MISLLYIPRIHLHLRMLKLLKEMIKVLLQRVKKISQGPLLLDPIHNNNKEVFRISLNIER